MLDIRQKPGAPSEAPKNFRKLPIPRVFCCRPRRTWPSRHISKLPTKKWQFNLGHFRVTWSKIMYVKVCFIHMWNESSNVLLYFLESSALLWIRTSWCHETETAEITITTTEVNLSKCIEGEKHLAGEFCWIESITCTPQNDNHWDVGVSEYL